MYGYIYLTTNHVNGKKYIGRHKSSTFDSNYYGSGKILTQAILKEGIENFTCEILDTAETNKELNYKEFYYIEKYNAVKSSEFYNLVEGGLGGSVKGVIFVHNENITTTIFPEELQEYLDKGFVRGKPSPREETIRKRVVSNTGKKRTEETRNNISKSLTGRKLSEEHRKKCALGRKGIPSYNRGQVEVNNQIEYLFVNKEDVQTYLDRGYVLGGRPHVNGDHRKGKIAVNKDNHTYFINPSELDIYLLNGYQKGGIPRSKDTAGVKRHWYNNGVENIMLNEGVTPPIGYVRGRIIPEEQIKAFAHNCKGKPAWNKGLNKEDPRVAKCWESRRAKSKTS